MKKTAILLASSAAVMAAPAQAREGQWYIGADAGVSFEDQVDVDIDEGNSNDVQTNAAFADTETGLDVAALVGYDFGAVRLEFEGGYKRAGYSGLTVLDSAILPDGITVPSGTVVQNEDDLEIWSAMLNALLEFGSDDGLQVFGGGGFGVAEVSLPVTVSGVGSVIDDQSAGIAWQLLAGFRFPVTEKIDLGVRYRYFNTSEFEFNATNLQPLEADYHAHSVLASLRVNLGKKAEAPPPPVEPPPPIAITRPPEPIQEVARPAPPPVTPCNTGPYIVFFDWDESAITAEAANTLDQAVTAYASCGTARVMLAGHTDRSGSIQYNMALAERRNISVGNYLTGKGIPGSRISAAAFGESQPRKATADGVREQENRRVEVSYGPGSGM